jgi:tetratricopeptide (TPR) repeat protein
VIWIFPLLALAVVAGMWNWNLRIRRRFEALMQEGSEALAEAKYPQALDAFEAAYRMAKQIRLDNHGPLVWSTLNAATALRALGEKDAALEAAHSALSLTKADQETADYSLRLYTLLADLSEENGLAHKALGLRQNAVTLYREAVHKGADPLALAEQLSKLGAAFSRAGLPDHAAQVCSEAATIVGRSLPEHPERREVYAQYLASTAEMLVKAGNRQKAQESYENALSLQRELFGEKDARLVPALAGLAEIHTQQQRFEDAIRMFEEAYRLQVRAYGPSDARVGLILSSYAQTLQQAGKVDSAQDAATQAVKLLEMHEHPALASGLAALGGVLMASGELERAVTAFERADAATVTRTTSNSPLETAKRLEQHAEALERLNRSLEAEHLRDGAAAIRETLASVPPATSGPSV